MSPQPETNRKMKIAAHTPPESSGSGEFPCNDSRAAAELSLDPCSERPGTSLVVRIVRIAEPASFKWWLDPMRDRGRALRQSIWHFLTAKSALMSGKQYEP